MRRLRFLLNPIGSAGDVNPFLAVGVELRQRGHEVFVLTNPVFRSQVESLGMEFRRIGTREQIQHVGRDPRIHRQRSSWKLAMAWGAVGTMRESYHKIEKLNRPGRTVVATAALGFGAMIAHEVHRIPLATCLIDPDKLRGVNPAPVIPPMLLSDWVPRPMKQMQYWLADRLVVDPAFAPETNRFRAELGLPPVTRLVDRWWLSGDRVIGFFDPWFAPRSPDWPDHVELVGPTLWDPQVDSADWEPVEEFLASGPAPVLFVPGSAGASARQVFEVAVHCCQSLSCRAILLHRNAGVVPKSLPPEIRHVRYAPLRKLLPRCAAMVHHGGTGTALQGLGAGVPQLVCPRAFNHPDIAARIQRLGAGYVISPSRFKPGTAAGRLQRLLADTGLRERCEYWASRMRQNNAVERTCDLLEQLVVSEPNKTTPAPASPLGRTSDLRLKI